MSDFEVSTSVINPFGDANKQNSVLASSGALVSRENTEVMALVASAKRFPRNEVQCADRIANSFTRTSLASVSQYQFARGGNDITGPSIRAAEAIAQQWGNLSSGWREVSRHVGIDGVGVSEIEAFCVDYQSTSRNAITFTVRHWRDTKTGGYKLKEERDIYELCANQAQRRKRACILATIPGDVVDMAMNQAAVTLTSNADTSPEAMAKMITAFEPFGVTKTMIEKRIQRRLDAIQPAQVVMLKRVFASLRDEMSTPAEWFDDWQAAGALPKGSETSLAEIAKTAKGKKPTAASVTDSSTGETTPPPGRKARSYAQFVDLVQRATDGETAALVLDEARIELNEQMQDELALVWSKNWGKD